jgi:hypothetical protein
MQNEGRPKDKDVDIGLDGRLQRQAASAETTIIDDDDFCVSMKLTY